MSNLLASAPTLDAIGDSIARFYCGERKTLEPEADKPNAWLVIRADRTPLLGVRVFKRGKRFRFEMVA